MGHVSDQLQVLEDAELVLRLAEDDQAYFFKHALIQESAYELLLMKKRREIHRWVANAYEQLYPDRLDENAALLAEHYSKAGDDEKTFVYARRAGDAAARVFAYPEASAHYAHALAALARLPNTEEHRRQRVDTLLRHVGVSVRAAGPVETLRRLAEAEALARPFAERKGATREDRLRLGRVRYWRGQALIHHNETRAAIQELHQVLQVAEAEGDPKLMAMPASVIGRTLVAQGEFAQALPVLTDAVRALEEIHDDHEWVLAEGFRGVALTMLGEYAAGLADAERALAHATAANNLTGIALAHGALGMVHFFGNALSPAVMHARAMIETAAQSGDRLYAYTAYGFLAWADVRMGHRADAESDFAQAQTIAQEIGGPLLFSDWFEAAQAECALRCGRVEQALTLAAQMVGPTQGHSSLFAAGFAERIQGQALARMERMDLDEAENLLKASLEKFQAGGARLEAARTHVAWGQLLAQHGDEQAAREHLEKAAAQFQASGLTGELEQTERLIASLPTRDRHAR